MSRVRYLLALFALMLFAPSSYAQWQTVGPQDFSSPDRKKGCSISYADGVVWAGGHSLYRSDDLGLSWQLCSTFPANNDLVLGIYFFDRNNGYVLSDFETYNTTDGGVTWTQLPYHSSRWGAYGSTADTFYLSVSGQIDILVKGNIAAQFVGTEWISPITAHNSNVYYLDNSVVHRSQDGGATWNPSDTLDDDCNAMAIDSCDPNTIYLVNEEIFVSSRDAIPACMFISHDGGKSWVTRNPHPSGYYAGDLATSRSAVYTQTQDGIIRSTDLGETWMSIDGPSGPPDNLSLAVVADSIVLAIDSFGNMWRTYNDGGYPFQRIYSKPELLSSSSIFSTDTVPFCDSALASSVAISCRSRGLKTVLLGPDNSEYSLSVKTRLLTDSCSIRFHPTNVGKHSATLLMIYGTDTLSVDLGGIGIANPPLALSSNSLFQSTSIGMCDSVAFDSLRIHYGCPMRHVVSATITGVDAGEYQLVRQGHDGEFFIDSFDLKYTPTADHQSNATLVVTYDDGTSASIPLAGSAKSTAPLLANPKDTLFKSARLYTCELPVRDSTLVILNCNRRTVTSALLGGADVANYALLRTARNTKIDQDSFFVSFHPSAPGVSNGTLTVTYDDGTTLTVPLRGEGLANPVASVGAVNVQLGDTIGATVRVPIVIRHDQALAAVEFRLLYDTTLLIFDRFANAKDVTLASSEIGIGMEHLHAPVSLDTLNDTVYAYFYWYPTTDSVTVDSIDNIVAIPVGDGCPVNINPTTSSHITGPTRCETPMITYFVRYGQAPYLSIHPNPASTSITLASNLRGAAVTLSDALGRALAHFESIPSEIDVSAYPSGLYYLELMSDRQHVSKAVMIAR